MAAAPSTEVMTITDARGPPEGSVQPLLGIGADETPPNAQPRGGGNAYSSSSTTQIPTPRIEATMVNLKNGISVDSALLSAMRDTRERFALLKCEQSMIDFIKSNAQEIDVGGAYNSVIVGLPSVPQTRADSPGRQTSFQRCWLHRLSDRFGIVRESISPEWIRCKKTPESAIPDNLLIDLQPSDYSLEKQATNAMSQLSINGNGTGNKTVMKRNKMKIMKRNPSNASDASRQDGSKTSNSTKKGAVTFTEKEKAYADARARIFKDDPPEDEDTPSSAPASLTPSQVVKTEQISDDQDGEGNGGASSTGAVSKATWRNRQQEENDPDFQRGVAYSAHQHYQQQYGYYAQQYHQQHMASAEQYAPTAAGFRGASTRGRGQGRGYSESRRGTADAQDYSTFR